ncbi:MAG: nucleotide exchange factor GrpE [Oscillospiraceae bacterium]|nr:nucleotide exchange factor GrpE [Oscillospiraceae bacterium]
MSKKKQPNDELVGGDAPIDPVATETPDECPISALEEALKAEQDRVLRIAAEYDNFRKRSQRDREALYADLKTGTVAEFLPVYDNLERALKQETEDEAFYRGLEMTMAGLQEVFTKLGVTEIPALGETFDPELHNAISHVADEAYGNSEIIEQFLAGFKLGDKVIRHSMVKVAN